MKNIVWLTDLSFFAMHRLEDLRAFFEAADVDKSGTVSFQEVVNALTDASLGVGISEEDAKGYALMVLQSDCTPF